MNLIIDEELKALLRPLSADEYIALEESIRENGIYDKVKVWGSHAGLVVIDGMHRKEIGDKIGLEAGVDYQVDTLQFGSKEDVMYWMEAFQLGRRNISLFRKYEIIKRRMSKTDTPNVRNYMADKTGMSKGSIAQAEFISKNATEDILHDLRRGEISINQGYQRTRKKESPQDYSVEGNIIKQIPSALNAGFRSLRIFAYFECVKQSNTEHQNETKIAIDFRNHVWKLEEESLSTDTIVKSYTRMRDEIRKNKDKILGNDYSDLLGPVISDHYKFFIMIIGLFIKDQGYDLDPVRLIEEA